MEETVTAPTPMTPAPANVNLALSLDEIIAQRRSAEKKEKPKKRTPLKSKSKQSGNKPTPTQKSIGSGKAKRDAKMASKRGMSRGAPSKGQIDSEIKRQQARDNQKGSKQGCRVYFGNLSFETTWQQLKDYIRSNTNVGNTILRADIMTHADSKKSKGYGIVEFASPKAAQEACRTLNDTEFQGRNIAVREDRANADAADGRSGARDAHAQHNEKMCSVFVGNLSFRTSWQDLKDHMRQAGNVDRATVIQGPDGRSKGCGIVVFQHPKDAKRAIATLQGSMLHERELFIREDREGSEKDGPTGRGGKNLAVYVGNLAFETQWQDLKDHMRRAGNVDRATVLTGPDGRSKGCGIVVYQHPKDAERAIKTLQDTELGGRMIFVREDREGGGNGGFRGPR